MTAGPRALTLYVIAGYRDMFLLFFVVANKYSSSVFLAAWLVAL